MDGGFGTTDVRNWVLSRGSQVVATIRHSGRGRTLRHHLGPWQPPSSPGRERASVVRPPRCCRATRQGGMRPPKEHGGSHCAVLRTTVTELEPVAVGDADESRALIAASCCQAQQARGLVKRRQHTWEAQHMVLLWARLAHHILLWSKRWLRQVPATRWR
jgi:hypothetical protein